MKRNSDYYLTYLAGVPYLLPFGQMLAGHRRSIRINESGAAVWELLKTPMEPEELIERAVSSFQAPPENKEELGRDITSFIKQLEGLGMIENVPAASCEPAVYLRIAGLFLQLCVPEDAVFEYFNSFRISREVFFADGGCADQVIRICGEAPLEPENGFYLLKEEQLEVYEMRECFRLQFPAFSYIKTVFLEKDGSLASFYCSGESGSDSLKEELFHAIRVTFLYLAEKKQMYAIHSASICYRNRAWLFSGQSGTGKSTHTGLWNRYVSAPILNGDINLLAFEKGRPVIHGIPWCGTSEIWDTRTWERKTASRCKAYSEEKSSISFWISSVLRAEHCFSRISYTLVQILRADGR